MSDQQLSSEERSLTKEDRRRKQQEKQEERQQRIKNQLNERRTPPVSLVPRPQGIILPGLSQETSDTSSQDSDNTSGTANQISGSVLGNMGIKPTLEYEYGDVPLERIRSNPKQPRKFFSAIEELAESMKKGQLEPIRLRWLKEEPDILEIVLGERRYRAATLNGWTHIRSEIIISYCSDDQAMEMALAENIARADLHPLEEAEAICERLSRKDEDERPLYSYRSLAAAIGADKGKIELYVKLHEKTSPDAKQLIIDDPTFPPRMVVEIGGIENPSDRAYLIQLVTSNDQKGRRMPTNDLIHLVSSYKKAQQLIPKSSSTPSPSEQERQQGQEEAFQQPEARGNLGIAEELISDETRDKQLQKQRGGESVEVVTTTVSEYERTLHPSPAMAYAALQSRLAKLDDQLNKGFKEIRKMPIDAQGQELLLTYAEEFKKKIDQHLLG